MMENEDPSLLPSADVSRGSRRQFLHRASLRIGGILGGAAAIGGWNLEEVAAWAASEETAEGESAEKSSEKRLPRDNLLVFRDEFGRERPVESVADWKRRRQSILRGMQEVMGPLPSNRKRCPLEVRVIREMDEGSYVQRLISYAAEPGGRVPAYLLIPKEALTRPERTPAVLSLLGTGMVATAFSKEAMVETGFPRFEDHRDYTRELAERGFVTLTPAYPWLGTYEPDLKGLGYESGTMKAIWDNIRGLDLLDSLPFVRPGHYGAIGHSLGGHNALYTAAFENRIQAVASSCGFDSYLDYMDGDIRGWAQERYMPRIKDYPLEEIPFDFHEVLGALAPRAVFVNAPTRDSNFKWKSAARIVEVASQVYSLYEATPPRIEHPDAEHSFPDEQRAEAIAMLQRELKTPFP